MKHKHLTILSLEAATILQVIFYSDSIINEVSEACTYQKTRNRCIKELKSKQLGNLAACLDMHWQMQQYSLKPILGKLQARSFNYQPIQACCTMLHTGV